MFLSVTGLLMAFGQGLLAHFGPAGSRPIPQQQAKSPGPPTPSTGPQAVSLAADASGHFSTDVRINNLFVKGLVDTGATVIAIPGDDAKKLGLNPPASAYTTPIQTANGRVNAATVRLAEVRIGTVVVRDVEAVIVPQGLHVTLVGMSFFNRLQSFEMRGKTLVLRQ
ncbi:MAG: TIGR02281 family clan AA aspartic protease [Proteobacteria bacterium]|nr:TIGR02281 family clan AA aspartic protease [Pseudomonadota bacterium]